MHNLEKQCQSLISISGNNNTVVIQWLQKRGCTKVQTTNCIFNCQKNTKAVPFKSWQTLWGFSVEITDSNIGQLFQLLSVWVSFKQLAKSPKQQKQDSLEPFHLLCDLTKAHTGEIGMAPLKMEVWVMPSCFSHYFEISHDCNLISNVSV